MPSFVVWIVEVESVPKGFQMGLNFVTYQLCIDLQRLF